jgi:hypothetical protein
MNLYPEMPLDQIGAQAKAHITAGDKAKEKAEQHYKAAGLYLIAARERVKSEGKHWVAWLREHVRVAPSTAYEIIAIADGTKTVEDIKKERRDRDWKRREKQKDASDRFREPRKNPDPTTGPTTGTEGQDILEEVSKDSDTLSRIIARLKRLDQTDLEWVEKSIIASFGE